MERFRLVRIFRFGLRTNEQGLLRLEPILDAPHTFVVRAVRAAEHFAAGLHAVSDDFAAAMPAYRRQSFNGAFEAIEGMHLAPDLHLKRFVVIVATNFTSWQIVPFGSPRTRPHWLTP
jgi:hypothetical protein